MNTSHLAAAGFAAILGLGALAAPAAAQTYVTPGYTTGPVYHSPGMYQQPTVSVPGRPGRVISSPYDNPDGALVYQGYGNKPYRVTPSGMRTGVYGQPCRTVEKTDQKGLLRSYTYCN